MKKTSKQFTVCLKIYVGLGEKKDKVLNIKKEQLGVVAHPFNPSTLEEKAGRSLCVQGQPGLQSEFKNSQKYTEKPCLKKQKIKNKRNRG